MSARLVAEIGEVLDATSKLVDRLQSVVHKANKRPPAVGRETPFWGKKRFIFRPFELEPRFSPLVESAQRTTRILRITHSAHYIVEAAFPTSTAMRPTPRGMYAEDSVDNITFDFEWALQIGSTERSYGQSINGNLAWLGRRSLGNPEVDYQLLFDPRFPIVLNTNEFLTFGIRPLFWPPNGFAANPGPRSVAIDVVYAATREFNSGDR